jgi:carboxypeptidase C (cathepsin A)
LPKATPGLTTPSSNPAEECRKAGKVWDGKKCLGRAEQCRAKGGVWDKATKTCKLPSSTVPR